MVSAELIHDWVVVLATGNKNSSGVARIGNVEFVPAQENGAASGTTISKVKISGFTWDYCRMQRSSLVLSRT